MSARDLAPAFRLPGRAPSLLRWLRHRLPQTAHVHGIAGNRHFPGTLTFDDPAVPDEAIVLQRVTLIPSAASCSDTDE
jgi:hypothetical protein